MNTSALRIRLVSFTLAVLMTFGMLGSVAGLATIEADQGAAMAQATAPTTHA